MPHVAKPTTTYTMLISVLWLYLTFIDFNKLWGIETTQDINFKKNLCYSNTHKKRFNSLRIKCACFIWLNQQRGIVVCRSRLCKSRNMWYLVEKHMKNRQFLSLDIPFEWFVSLDLEFEGFNLMIWMPMCMPVTVTCQIWFEMWYHRFSQCSETTKLLLLSFSGGYCLFLTKIKRFTLPRVCTRCLHTKTLCRFRPRVKNKRSFRKCGDKINKKMLLCNGKMNIYHLKCQTFISQLFPLQHHKSDLLKRYTNDKRYPKSEHKNP